MRDPNVPLEEFFLQSDGPDLNGLCGYAVAGSDDRIERINDTILQMTGYFQEEVIGQRTFQEFLSPAGRMFFQSQAGQMLQLNGIARELAFDLVHKDGRRTPVLINILQRSDHSGKVISTEYAVFSASERTRYEKELIRSRTDAENSRVETLEANRRLAESNTALFEQRERFRVTLNAISDGVIATDTFGMITYLNPAATDLCASSSSEALGRPLQQVFCPVDQESGTIFDLRENAFADPDPGALQTKWLLCKAGKQITLSLTVAVMHHESGEQMGFLVCLRDISAAAEYEAKLHDLATHDPLTRLFNRPEFERRLAMALLPEGEYGCSLLYLDLDQFKVVNDTCGHEAGDELMRRFANLMRRTLRKDDTSARLGGDEFGIILRRNDPGEALVVAERLRQAVSELDFVWDGMAFPIGVSIGLVDLRPGLMTLADALRIADTACYVAKEKGRNRVHVSTRDDEDVERRKGEMNWISRLHSAIKENRFVLFGQRITPLQLADGRHEHIEVLIRMIDVDGTLVPPMAFIPAAERYGLMAQIDRWVLHTLLQQFRTLHPAGTQAAVYAVNISATTLCDDSFVDFACKEFARHQVPPSQICFEITETAAIANLDQAVLFVSALKELGCRFSLDDFGSGMSSFAYLKRLPVDTLKIDGRFVRDIMSDPVSHAMVEAFNRVGQVMGLSTVAEFVESEDVLQALRKIGIDYAQGYGVHVPEPLLEFG